MPETKPEAFDLGAPYLHLDGAAGVTAVEFRAGQALVVPRGVWHRLRVREAGRVLFVTWGEGTRHRPL